MKRSRTKRSRTKRRGTRKHGGVKATTPYQYNMNQYIRNEIKYNPYATRQPYMAHGPSSTELEEHMVRQHGFVNQLTANNNGVQPPSPAPANQAEIDRLEAELRNVKDREAGIQRRIHIYQQMKSSLQRQENMKKQLAAIGK